MATLRIPHPDGSLAEVVVREPRPFARPSRALESRVVYAAVHVVCDPLAENGPGQPARLDWEQTVAFRRHVWSWGLGVAEAMDTAQRGMGLDWAATQELIRVTVAEAVATGGLLACGAGTDHLGATTRSSLEEVERAYEEQCSFVESVGGRIILMASRHLARAARGPDDYRHVYGRILSQVSSPVIIHWLGEMFDPELTGYWGSSDLDGAAEVCLSILADHAAKIDGIKISLLDRERELDLRRRIPAGVRLYTGNDLDYADLIRGDGDGHCDALLGIFDSIAPAASAAVQALDERDLERYDAVLSPTLPLARHLFAAPTHFYKTGIVFMAYLNGLQDHFRMVGGLESGRSLLHLTETFRLAAEAGLLDDPELAVERMRLVLRLGGVDT